MSDTFKHDYKTILGGIDIAGINGYCKALLQVVGYLNEVTEGNPEKRYIDAVPLLEKITRTTLELRELSKDYEADINNLLNLQN